MVLAGTLIRRGKVQLDLTFYHNDQLRFISYLAHMNKINYSQFFQYT
jgi:hypothetical protein